MEADIALIGLAVMGQNLALNIHDHGYQVVVFNRTKSKIDDFLAGPAKNSSIKGAYSLQELFSLLKKPRKVMLMVQAGMAVDELIEESLPYLEKGDLIIDGGNSHFADTQRREETLKKKGILFIGMGISGGEKGARYGPSIMPGGNQEGWPKVQEIFQKIAAKAEDGSACCEWIGEGGAGHYVKMIHNGIEYGDMQLISEAYHILARLGMGLDELHKLFNEWNHGKLNSYLIEITARIFAVHDTDGTFLLNNILDIAAQKGTGKWMAINAFDWEVPVTLIGEAVWARALSALKEERCQAAKIYSSPKKMTKITPLAEQVKEALYAAKIVSYAQGFMLMTIAAYKMGWNLNLGKVALTWRGGCIIRSRFLGEIQRAFVKNPNLSNLLLDEFFCDEMKAALPGWREVVAEAVLLGISVPCLGAGLSFFDGYTTAQSPANLIQAQRDFFGSHTYERKDQPRNRKFHTEWED